MKRLTEAGIALEPRSILACIDLAFRYFSQHAPAMMGWVCAVSFPAMLLTGVVARVSSAGWGMALVTTAIGTVMLGLLVVTHASSIAFCKPLGIRETASIALWKCVPLIFLKSLIRLAAFLLSPFVIPSLMLLVISSFRNESRILTYFRSSQHEHRTQDLVKQEFTDLLLRMIILSLFGGLFWFVTALSFDASMKLLLDYSPLIGTLAQAGEDPWGYLDFFQVLSNMAMAALTDWRLLTAVQFVTFFVYALLRLAWYFTYIDLRIRRDCWDLEVALADETLRWEEPTDVAA